MTAPEFNLSLPADLPGEWIPFGDHAADLGKGAGWRLYVDDFTIQLAPRAKDSTWCLFASAPDWRTDLEHEPLSIRINVSGESVRAVLGAMWDRTIEDTKHGNDWSVFRLAFDGIREWCWTQSKAVPVEVAPAAPVVKANSAPTFRGAALDESKTGIRGGAYQFTGTLGGWSIRVSCSNRWVAVARHEYPLDSHMQIVISSEGCDDPQSALDDLEANIQKLKEAL